MGEDLVGTLLLLEVVLLPWFVVGVELIVVGALVLRARPLLARVWTVALPPLVLLALPLGTSVVFFFLLGGYDEPVRQFIPLVALCAIAIVLVWLILRGSFLALLLCNVDEEMVYASVKSALDKRNTRWEEKHGRILLTSLGLEIELYTRPSGRTAIVRFPRSMGGGVRRELVSDLKAILCGKAVHRGWAAGILAGAAGLVFLAAGSWVVASFLSSL